MKYLYKIDYAAMIYEVLKEGLNSTKASEYFYAQYTIYKEQNINFVKGLKEAIDFTFSEYNRICKAASDSIAEEGEWVLYEGYDWNLSFCFIYPQPKQDDGFYELKKHNYEFNEDIILTRDYEENINEGFQMFLTILNSEKGNENDKPQNYQNYKTFKNNFDKVESFVVYKHFYDQLVVPKYISSEELNNYLKCAFELNRPPAKRFKLNDKNKKRKIKNVFYLYNTKVSERIQGKTKRYAALLGDYFIGYNTDDVYSNFSK